ncbi:hypothetical protein BJ742DRAFT_783328 [Cladochytrium replicatum]|nr:hypothetical protein BJ742DRAFT_783328 [Cladochytrium replicatum]
MRPFLQGRISTLDFDILRWLCVPMLTLLPSEILSGPIAAFAECRPLSQTCRRLRTILLPTVLSKREVSLTYDNPESATHFLQAFSGRPESRFFRSLTITYSELENLSPDAEAVAISLVPTIERLVVVAAGEQAESLCPILHAASDNSNLTFVTLHVTQCSPETIELYCEALSYGLRSSALKVFECWIPDSVIFTEKAWSYLGAGFRHIERTLERIVWTFSDTSDADIPEFDELILNSKVLKDVTFRVWGGRNGARIKHLITALANNPSAEITAMKIQGFMLVNEESDDLAEALRHARALQTLERLELQRVSAPALTSLAPFIGSWTELRHLRLFVPPVAAAHGIASALVVSHSIQEVSVDGPIWDDAALEDFGRSISQSKSIQLLSLRRVSGGIAGIRSFVKGLAAGVTNTLLLSTLNLDWNEFDADALNLLKRIVLGLPALSRVSVRHCRWRPVQIKQEIDALVGEKRAKCHTFQLSM